MPTVKSQKQTIETFKTFGELLRFVRKRAHLTQSELGVLIGYHHSYISYIEKNLRTPDKATLLGRIVPALGLQDENIVIEQMLAFLEEDIKTSLPQFTNPLIEPTSKNIAHVINKKLTTIVGREYETKTLLQMLQHPKHRLITITGAPGVGKTSLALLVAQQIQALFNDGAIFVDLIPIQAPNLLLDSIASVLSKEKTSTQNIHLELQHKNLLILLDNFEHVLVAAPKLIEILENHPRIKILTTSREALHIYAEQEFPLTPLPLPSQFEKESPAIQLFIERAQSINLNFIVDENNASDIAQICYRLDGIPLAIEIAAAQTRTLSTSMILQKMDSRFQWLHREHNITPQQKTLQQAIAWSYNLLSEVEKKLFNRLSIFSGGWTLEAAEIICSDDEFCKREDIFTLLNQLVGKSLVLVDQAQARYNFLETLRVFSARQLKNSKDQSLTSTRHCEYFTNFATEKKIALEQKKMDNVLWLTQMKAEHNNFRSALLWVTTTSGNGAFAAKLMLSLSQFLMVTGNIKEARRWLDDVLALEDLDKKIKVTLLHHASDFAGKQGDETKSLQYQKAGLEIAKKIEDPDAIYLSIEGMARVEYRLGNFARAIEMLEEALLYKRSRPNKIGIIRSLNYLAICYRESGNFERALELGLESIEICRSIESLADLAQALIGVAEVYVKKKEFRQALPFQYESLALAKQLVFHHGIAVALSFMAHSIHHLAEPVLATQMESASHKIRREIGVAPATPTSVEKNKKFQLALQNKLGKKRFEEEWENGEKISVEEIITQALRKNKELQNDSKKDK